MSTNVSLETGKLTDGHRTSLRSATYRVIYKNENTTTSTSSWDIREIHQKNNDVLMTSQQGPNTAQADDIP